MDWSNVQSLTCYDLRKCVCGHSLCHLPRDVKKVKVVKENIHNARLLEKNKLFNEEEFKIGYQNGEIVRITNNQSGYCIIKQFNNILFTLDIHITYIFNKTMTGDIIHLIAKKKKISNKKCSDFKIIYLNPNEKAKYELSKLL
jgi:hypothetical protein